MKNHDKHSHPTNFWFGFAAGTLGASAIAYFLGTKKGREALKKCIAMAENLEENSPDFMDQIRKILNTVTDRKPFEMLKEEVLVVEKKTIESISTIENVLDKIKEISQPQKYVKKFFSKSGKIIKG